MTAWMPATDEALWLVVATLAAALGLAFALSRLPAGPIARALAWMLAAGALIAAERATAGEPAGFRMVAIIQIGRAHV